MVQAAVSALFGLALAICFWPGQAGAAEPSRWCFLGVAMPAMLFLIRVRPSLPNLLVAATLTWAAASLLWTDAIWDGLRAYSELIVLAGLFVIGQELKDPRYLYLGLGTGMAVNSGFAILQWMGFEPVITQFPGSGPAGLFVNPSLLGEASSMMLVLLLANRMWLLSTLTAPSLVLSQNRAGFIACGACVLYMVWKWNRWAAIAALAVIGAAATHIIKPNFYDSFMQRTDIWRDAIEGLTVFGRGIGSFYVDFPLYHDHIMGENTVNWTLTAHAHNDTLELLFELGIPGLILMAALGWVIWQSAAYGERYALGCVLISGLAGFPLREPFTAAVAALLAGIAAGRWDLVRGIALCRRPALYRWGQQPFAEPFAPSRADVAAGSLLPAWASAAGDPGQHLVHARCQPEHPAGDIAERPAFYVSQCLGGRAD